VQDCSPSSADTDNRGYCQLTRLLRLDFEI
jgi:hypothetical protein